MINNQNTILLNPALNSFFTEWVKFQVGTYLENFPTNSRIEVGQKAARKTWINFNAKPTSRILHHLQSWQFFVTLFLTSYNVSFLHKLLDWISTKTTYTLVRKLLLDYVDSTFNQFWIWKLLQSQAAVLHTQFWLVFSQHHSHLHIYLLVVFLLDNRNSSTPVTIFFMVESCEEEIKVLDACIIVDADSNLHFLFLFLFFGRHVGINLTVSFQKISIV